MTTSPPATRALLDRILSDVPLRAGSFIVTIYGDVVEPRGGRLWIGNIIETCASVGISETLVRTAVSRLVAANQLIGERDGRRSFYRLTDQARREYLAAARVLFEPPSREGWCFVWLPQGRAEAAAPGYERAGFVRLGTSDWLIGPGPNPDPEGPAAGLVFRAETGTEPRALAALVSAHWDLAPHQAAYDGFIARFEPIEAALHEGRSLAPAEALEIRLLLVQLFRQVALGDPRLPDEALPATWSGGRARHLFARLYGLLSDAADAHVGARFVTADGELPARPPAVEHRLAALRSADRAARG